MQKGNLLKINLLPADFLAAQKEYQKFHKIQFLCVFVILLLAFLSSLTVALRVFQTQRVDAAQSELEENTNRVSLFKDTEAQLTVLKDRLSTIDKLTQTPSKQRQMYNLVTELLPPQMVLNSVTVDQGGTVTLSLVASSIDAVESLTDSLLLPESSEGLISKVEVENLARSRDGLFRVGLKVTTN